MAKLKPLELRVVLDTNALYTGSANFFIRKEVADLIDQHKGLPDLEIAWYVPTTVRDERHFQMLTEAQRFLEPIGKLERLLGHNLNITSDILNTRVQEAIDKQIADHGLSIIPFSPEAIDWRRLAADAAFRRAPFQVGEKEKGFRDAMVLESLLQLVSTSPSTPSSCRVALVSGDELLRAAAESRTTGAQNVHILESIDALKGLINTLGSAVDEQFIGALQPKAANLFFTSADEDTLYYRWGISDQLKTILAAVPISLPADAGRYVVEKWLINTPRFLKKQGQRLSWISRIDARVKAVKMVQYTSWPQPSKIILPSSGSEKSPLVGTTNLPPISFPSNVSISNLGFGQPSEAAFYGGGLLSFPEQQQSVASGVATLDVTWSVSVTTKSVLKSPKLDGVAFVDIVWE
jgi:PIN domain-containing protein